MNKRYVLRSWDRNWGYYTGKPDSMWSDNKEDAVLITKDHVRAFISDRDNISVEVITVYI